MATIVSIAPCEFREEKPSVIPKTYIIPKCLDKKNPVFVTIQDAVTYEYIDENRGNKIYPIPATDLATAIVSDIVNVMFGKDKDKNAFPGLVAVPKNVHSLDQLNKEYPGLFAKLEEQQLNWYKQLVFIADDDWTKFHQHKMISSLSIAAANFLGLNREWIVDFTATAQQCPACMSFVASGAVICKHCMTVLDAAKYAVFQRATKG
jgi:hypothetical protein